MFFLIAILMIFKIDTVSSSIIPSDPQKPKIAAGPPMPEMMARPALGPVNAALSAGGPTAKPPQVPSSNVLQPLLGSAGKPPANAINSVGNAAQPGPSNPLGQSLNGPSNAKNWAKQLENDVWPNKTAVNLYAYYLEAFHEAKAFYNRHMPSYEEEKKAFLHFVKKTHDSIEKDMEEKLGLKGVGDTGNIAKVIPPRTDISIGQAAVDNIMKRPQISATLGQPQPMNPQIQNVKVTSAQKPFGQGPAGQSIPKKPHLPKNKIVGGKDSSRGSSGSSSTTSSKVTMSGEGGSKSTTSSSKQTGDQSSQANVVGGATAAPKRREPLTM